MQQTTEHYPGIDQIAFGIRWTQELILVLSVPALTLGLIIGTYDFLSGGFLLHIVLVRNLWTLLQAITLDACFAMYWVKVFFSTDWRERLGSLILGVLLGCVAGGINFLQQVAEVLHVTALQSLLQLGFPPEVLLLLRALLSVVLLAVAACSVARKQHASDQSKQVAIEVNAEEAESSMEVSIEEEDEVVKAYPKTASWLTGTQRTATIEQIAEVTGLSKRRIINRLNDGVLKRSPRNANLILISSVIEWLKTAGIASHTGDLPIVKATSNGHHSGDVEALKVEAKG